MRLKQLAWLVISFLAATALTACNIGATPAPTVDVNAIYTEAAQTALAGFSAQLTQTAQAAPATAIPTNTALATFTMLPTFPPLAGTTPLVAGTPGPGTLVAGTPLAINTAVPTLAGPQCNSLSWIQDIGVQDGDVMKPHQDFTKIWEVKNTGTCAWDEGYALVFVAGENLSGGNITLTSSTKKYFTEPGATQRFEIVLDVGDSSIGTHTGCWRMKDDKGYYFGTVLCYTIEVKK